VEVAAVSGELVLSLFPGIGLLDMAFEAEGFCVVRGPDLLWGGDVRRFHPPSGRFDGVIGGPPCQAFSIASRRWPGGSRRENLIPEFERVVHDAKPRWFLMENVPQAPRPRIAGFATMDAVVDNNALGEEQRRTRRFTFGSRTPAWFNVVENVERPRPVPAVTASGHGSANFAIPSRNWRERARLQGVDPERFERAPMTAIGLATAIGNGVPIPMGRAVARAVRDALGRSAA
jgi:DNA (cytosine-5)-methyltransferase 1